MLRKPARYTKIKVITSGELKNDVSFFGSAARNYKTTVVMVNDISFHTIG